MAVHKMVSWPNDRVRRRYNLNYSQSDSVADPGKDNLVVAEGEA
jgi:hypothetical protein